MSSTRMLLIDETPWLGRRTSAICPALIENVRERDAEIIKSKSVKPDTLQLTVNIKFAG